MKNKISKYDFLIVGGGLIGALTALALYKKNFKVVLTDKKNNILKDNRTLAVNANSKEFLEHLGIWKELKSKPQPIDKILIKDYINSLPLIFNNKSEPMGNVIFNKEMYQIIRKKVKNLNILKTNVNLNIENLMPRKKININKKNYIFKKIIVSVGKNINSIAGQKSIVFDKGHHSYVGFFKHTNDHKNVAYEIFKKEGPLAVLPCPSLTNKKSTYIYSTTQNISHEELHKMIDKDFKNSHGKLEFDKSISMFPISPHLKKYNKDFIYIGDTLRSIHPVAGQGWNLGVKDIQTLCKLTEQYSLDSKIFNSLYYSKRIIESSLYFGFTSFVNFLYENKSTFNKNIVKIGYQTLKNIGFVRDLFIKQAMGKINLID
mgnify:CR=1 FL=1|tara:strand:- start:41 stop:1162 length:1122 start_codon:yes stop_codon:yes gene_type:complete